MKSTHTIVVPIGEHTPSVITPDTKRIITCIGRYHRAVEDKDFIYFVNYQEGDENGQTMMYRKNDLELVSDNYFASQHLLFDVMLKGEYTYISRYAKQNISLYKKQNPNWKEDLN